MERCYSHFNSDIPEMVDGLKKFIIEVNKFLIGLVEDKKYHHSQTRGKSSYRKVTFEDKPWIFEGKRHRRDVPFTDKATIKFRGKEAWAMTRESKLMPTAQAFTEEIQHCLREVAKNYNPDLPWCGPDRLEDQKVGLVYEANYSGTDKNFEIQETIRDAYGALLWQATCNGGYV